MIPREAAFYVLEVDALSDAPRDYTSDDEGLVQAGLPQWISTCTVLQFGRLL